jgi:hypothetical protein
LVTDQGLTIWYRRERGDVQSIREILIDEIYRLPDGIRPTSLVDFGAHIGVATAWLCREYDIHDAVAVEPHPDNFRILERNCQDNQIGGLRFPSAVGRTPATPNSINRPSPISGERDRVTESWRW